MKKRDKKQLLPGIVLSVAVGFLVFLYAPIDLYCSNADEFWFDFGILFTAALGLFAVCVAVMSLAYIVLWLIHPVAYRIGLAGGFIALICTMSRVTLWSKIFRRWMDLRSIGVTILL